MKRHMFLITASFLFLVGCQSKQKTESQAAVAAIKPILNDYEQLVYDLAEKPVSEWSEVDKRMWQQVKQEWQSLNARVSNLNDASLRKQAQQIESKMGEIRLSNLSEAMLNLETKSSQPISRKSQMSNVEKRELLEETMRKSEEVLAGSAASEDIDAPGDSGPLLNIIIMRQLLAGLIEVGQIAASAGVQPDQQTAKDMESKFVTQITDYIKDVQTKEEAFRKGQSLVVPSYSTETDEHLVEIQLTIRAIREAAKRAELSDELTQEILKPLVSLL